ncbi:NADPH-dependent FMN reductase [Streptomyces sp. SCSIO ZS0520]|uniref:NADPH-dependent FMN reductase n=1 Tax=Streptomyces sp. SCSIO ZS0520 TaxID=2892996 RepID=UPI0021D99B7D|nr:NADPH-dependent FMN reductase [Streptomyces sp. SCSIO ZS0520]
MSRPPLVLLLGGSPSPHSHTAAALEAAAKALTWLGAEALVWDLATRPLPIVDPCCYGRPDLYADPLARMLPATAARADAFLLASPAYHGSFSGALKNALDHLDGRELRGKPAGLLAHGEDLDAAQVCEGLRTVTRALGAVALPEQLVTVPEDFGRLDDGGPLLTDPTALDRLTSLCHSLLTYTRHAATPAAAGLRTA